MDFKISGNPSSYVVTNAITGEIVNGVQSVNLSISAANTYATLQILNPVMDITTGELQTGLITMTNNIAYSQDVELDNAIAPE